LVEEEVVGVNGGDLVVLERVLGEVAGVEGHDDLGVGANRSGQCRSFGSLAIASIKDSYPATAALGNVSRIWPIR
jgi:hypothetical protein